ncbi:MAG: hypothetical protein H7A24_11700 [Leptospiraceae bacterium]|nr:hypothetical protein [Leptospiraceae bacterium]MCP5512537.1 hypothetical protein [Leptospiraceae bacterium]
MDRSGLEWRWKNTRGVEARKNCKDILFYKNDVFSSSELSPYLMKVQNNRGLLSELSSYENRYSHTEGKKFLVRIDKNDLSLEEFQKEKNSIENELGEIMQNLKGILGGIFIENLPE